MRRTLLLAAALAWGLTACSGSEPAPAPTPAPASPSTAAAEVAATAPGTDLDFGEAATLVWQPEASLTGSLDLSVDAVTQEPQSVFRGWVRDQTDPRRAPLLRHGVADQHG